MLRLQLARLEREGSVSVRAQVPAQDPLWEGTGLVFDTPVSVNLRAQVAGSGEIVVLGQVEGVLRGECRRCLEPVRTAVKLDLTLVYAPEDLLAGGEADVRPIPTRARELDLGEAVREELVLSVDPFVLCKPDCKGLCPKCGVNWNQWTCECAGEEHDPRWDVLRRALKNE
jgi:uncharacterized protein